MVQLRICVKDEFMCDVAMELRCCYTLSGWSSHAYRKMISMEWCIFHRGRSVTAGEEMAVNCCYSVILGYYWRRCGIGTVGYGWHFTLVIDAWTRLRLIKSDRASLCWFPEPHGLKIAVRGGLVNPVYGRVCFATQLWGLYLCHPGVMIHISWINTR